MERTSLHVSFEDKSLLVFTGEQAIQMASEIDVVDYISVKGWHDVKKVYASSDGAIVLTLGDGSTITSVGESATEYLIEKRVYFPIETDLEWTSATYSQSSFHLEHSRSLNSIFAVGEEIMPAIKKLVRFDQFQRGTRLEPDLTFITDYADDTMNIIGHNGCIEIIGDDYILEATEAYDTRFWSVPSYTLLLRTIEIGDNASLFFHNGRIQYNGIQPIKYLKSHGFDSGPVGVTGEDVVDSIEYSPSGIRVFWQSGDSLSATGTSEFTKRLMPIGNYIGIDEATVSLSNQSVMIRNESNFIYASGDKPIKYLKDAGIHSNPFYNDCYRQRPAPIKKIQFNHHCITARFDTEGEILKFSYAYTLSVLGIEAVIIKTVNGLETIRPEDETCGCCLDKYADTALELPCGHAFHSECIQLWMRVKESCPMCRTVLPEKNLETSASVNGKHFKVGDFYDYNDV